MPDARDELALALKNVCAHRILVATHNPGKLKEWRWLLAGTELEVIGAADVGLSAPEETGKGYRENAELKARKAAGALNAHDIGLIVADDAGLSINALQGRPGVVTARFAERHGGYTGAGAQLRAALSEQNQSAPYQSYLHCALSLGLQSAAGWEFLTVEGNLPGNFIGTPRGSLGFGFDPWFVPRGNQRTLGEMRPNERDLLNHRAQAILELTRELRKRKVSLRVRRL